MIIKFWDNEGSEYSLVEIPDYDFPKFMEVLKECQKSEDYHWDDFCDMIGANGIEHSFIDYDEELFF